MRRPVTFSDDHLFKPLDGGWGYVVVAASAVLAITNSAVANIFGLVFGKALQRLGHETTAATLIGNIMYSVSNLSGLLTGPSVRWLDYRRVAITGILLATAGSSLTCLASQAWHMVITYGLLFGVGLGLQTPTSFLAVNTYWQRWRGRAVGVSVAGRYLGQIALPHLVALLLNDYGFSGAMLMLGAICLQALPAALLWQPLGWHSTPLVRGEELHRLRNPDDDGVARRDLAGRTSPARDDRPQLQVVQTARGVYCNALLRLLAFFDLDLLSSRRFCIVALGVSTVYAMNINFSIILPFYLQVAAGLSLRQTALCMSVRCVGDVICSVGLPCLTDKLRLPCRLVLFASAVATAVGRAVLTLMSGFSWVVAAMLVEGFGHGAFVVNKYICIADVAPPTKVAGAVGLLNFLNGLTALVLGPIIGHIRDTTGDYVLCIRLIAIIMGLVMAVWVAESAVDAARHRVHTSTSAVDKVPA